VPTRPQIEDGPAIARGESTLILAPTGTGKTLAAFLRCINRIMSAPAPTKRCRILYISPIKALAVDVERNFPAPLVGVAQAAQLLGEPFFTNRRFRARGDLRAGVASLTQSIIAGLGNVFKSEVCFACGVNPFRRMAGLHAEEVECLVNTARKFLLANVTGTSGDQMVSDTEMQRTTGRTNKEERLGVYGRRTLAESAAS